MRKSPLLLLGALTLLAGCEQVNQKLGLEDPAKKEARMEAEGKAVGSACRQSGRAIEDCYSIYNWLSKAAIYAGWREMDAYMRENKIDTVEPQLPPAEPPGNAKKKKKAAPADEGESKAAEDKNADKATEKTAEKAADKTGAKH